MKKILTLALFVVLGLSALYSAFVDGQTQFAQVVNVLIALTLFYCGLKFAKIVK